MIGGVNPLNYGLIESHLSKKNGNCLFESISCFIDDWQGKPFELRLKSITWAQKQVSQGTSWGMSMWMKFDETKANIDCYNKNKVTWNTWNS